MPAVLLPPRWLLRFLLVVGAYFLTGWLGLGVPYLDSHITLVWAPSGIALAALLRWSPHLWPGIWLGALLVNLSVGSSLPLALGIACGNALGPWLAAQVLRRRSFRPTLERRRDFFLYLLVAVIGGMAITAANGTLSLRLAGLLTTEGMPQAWLYWWLGDATGAIIAGIPLLALTRANLRQGFGPARWRETTLLLAVLLVLSGWLLDRPQGEAASVALFMSFLLQAWLGVRSGPWPAAAAALLLSAVTAWSTATGRGPFHAGDDVHAELIRLWAYMASLSLVGLLLSILIRELASSESRFRAFFEKNSSVMLLVEPESARIIAANETAARFYGYPLERLGEMRIDEINILPPEEVARERQRAMEEERNHFYFPHRLASGEVRDVEVYSTPVQLDSRPLLFSIVHDITEQRRAEAGLRQAASVFTHAREGIVITDANGCIIDVNAALPGICGYTREELIGRNPRIFKSGRHGPAFYAALWDDLLRQGHWTGEVWNRHRSGELYAAQLTISAVRDPEGRPVNYVGLVSDITAQKRHQQQLEHIAHHDALTGLPNRALLADRLHQAMLSAERRGTLLAVAYVDLDGFKAINDNHGHETGDALLTVLAGRMSATLRQGDTVARLGGDEFVAVLGDLADEKACLPLLARLLAALSQPVQAGDLLLKVSGSLGITFYPQAEAVDADQLLRQADQAMYQAKLAGRNQYHVFDAEKDRHVRGHHESLERIRQALQAGEFVLHYQPKVDMRSGRLVGAEALIRWQHPEKGLLPPADFLPVIEDHPLEVDIGEWVMAAALARMEAWQAAGLRIPVSVNVGARQLQQRDFMARLRTLLAAHPALEPGRLELEVLETSALRDLEQVTAVMRECAGIGVRFALDDFGTGYSSLSYLKRLPVGVLKIDQSFVRDMLDDPEDRAIIEGMLSLAGVFRREVVAEGVESEAHGLALLELGCTLAQGYGIARPMPGDELPAWAAAWRPYPAWAGMEEAGATAPA